MEIGRRDHVREGALVYDNYSKRIDVRFNVDDYYGGLHCGTCMDVMLNDEWIPTRIEMNDDWYLVGIKTDSLIGLRVRI